MDDKKFCKNCGGAISPDHKFCGNCGAMLSGGLNSTVLGESSASNETDFQKLPQDRLSGDTIFRCSKCHNAFKMTKGMSYPENCPHCGYVHDEPPSQLYLTHQPHEAVPGGEVPSTMLKESTSVDADLFKMNQLERPQDTKRQHLESGNMAQKSNGTGQLFCMNCGNTLPEKAFICMRCGRPVSDEKAIKRWAKKQEKLGSKPQVQRQTPQHNKPQHQPANGQVLMGAPGVGGQLELLNGKVRIKRKGLMALATHGLAGEKEIHIRHISSIRFKKAGALTNGYIQFSFRGGLENKGGLLDANTDENTVLFTTRQQAAFEQIKNAIEQQMYLTNQPPVVTPYYVQTPQQTSSTDISERIRKLAQLKEEGILTEEEFQVQKQKLLSKM